MNIEQAAKKFAETGWVMSGLITQGHFYSNIEAFDAPDPGGAR